MHAIMLNFGINFYNVLVIYSERIEFGVLSKIQWTLDYLQQNEAV